MAELPWYEIDEAGTLRCVDESVPRAIDMHCHLGMSVLFKPELDPLARTDRVRHLLDCDATDPSCDLDLDIYINGNFSDPARSEDLAAVEFSRGLVSRFHVVAPR